MHAQTALLGAGFENWSVEVMGYEIPRVLLLHANVWSMIIGLLSRGSQVRILPVVRIAGDPTVSAPK